MIGFALRAAGLTAVYLLVLTSLAPGDILVGAALGVTLAAALRGGRHARPRRAPSLGALRAAATVGAQTAAEMVRGSWRVVRLCLGAPCAPGLVEIPRGDRTRTEVAVWGVLTGEAPDEVVVDVDEERDVLVVHLVDASDPDAVRERHRRNHERTRRQVER